MKPRRCHSFLLSLALVVCALPAHAFGGGHWSSWAHRPWGPRDVAGASMTVWLSYQDGFAASQWTDRSGTGHHYTQATGGNQGTVGASGVVFNGSSTFYTGPTADAITSSANETEFVACTLDASSTNSANIYQNAGILDDAAALAWGAFFFKSAPSVATYIFDGGVKTSGPLAVSLSTPMILTSRHSGGNTGIRLNGGTEVTAAAGNRISDGSVSTELGRGNSAAYFQGKIKYLLVYNAALTAFEVTKVQQYLGAQTGISVP